MKEFLKEIQPIFYRILEKSFKENKKTHAFLLVGDHTDDIATFIAQSYICHKDTLACEVCDDCIRIKEGLYPDMIVYDGKETSIKKSDIDHIQEEFVKSSVENNGKVYILQNIDNPKEVTCKGGLSNPIKQDYEDIASTKIVYKSVNDGKNEFVERENYGDINDAYLNKAVAEVKSFIQFVFDLNKEFSFKNNFDSAETSLNVAQEECMRDLLTYTKNGLENKKKEVSDNDTIEETLFFYPLSGMLNALISAIYKKNNSSKN